MKYNYIVKPEINIASVDLTLVFVRTYSVMNEYYNFIIVIICVCFVNLGEIACFILVTCNIVRKLTYKCMYENVSIINVNKCLSKSSF